MTTNATKLLGISVDGVWCHLAFERRHSLGASHA